MDLKQLEVFAWVARLGSFSKAGEQLFLTQPTVSAHVGTLERELGVKLLVRASKMVYPTEEGNKLLTYADQMLTLRDEALAAIAAAGSRTPALCELFDIAPGKKGVISLVGAGGKTTLMYALARELAEQGKRVAVATTTRIFRPDARQCAHVVTDGDLEKIRTLLDTAHLVTVGTPADGGKLAAPAMELLHFLRDNADFLLVEADGSRCLPVKVPNESEPVMLPWTTHTLAVNGLSALGRPLWQICHRAGIAQEILQVREDHIFTTQDMAKLMWQSYASCGGKLTFVLNQADSHFLNRQAQSVSSMLLQAGACRVAVTSFLAKQFEYYTNTTRS